MIWSPEKLQKVGLSPSRGVLFYGPQHLWAFFVKRLSKVEPCHNFQRGLLFQHCYVRVNFSYRRRIQMTIQMKSDILDIKIIRAASSAILSLLTIDPWAIWTRKHIHGSSLNEERHFHRTKPKPQEVTSEADRAVTREATEQHRSRGSQRHSSSSLLSADQCLGLLTRTS